MKPQIKACVTGLMLSAAVMAHSECIETVPSGFDDSTFDTAAEGTVVDLATGLMWMRCPLGTQWQNNGCAGDTDGGELHTWEAALSATAGYAFGGYDDWRLPNKNELESLVRRDCFDPATDATLFPGTAATGYWTNSTNNFNSAFAWAINFASGEHISTRRSNEFAVRLVRDFSEP